MKELGYTNPPFPLDVFYFDIYNRFQFRHTSQLMECIHQANSGPPRYPKRVATRLSYCNLFAGDIEITRVKPRSSLRL